MLKLFVSKTGSKYIFQSFCVVSLQKMPGKRVASNGMETGPAAKLNKSLTDWKNITFDCKAKTGDEKEWNLKICR